jgi:imidazolonepropionase-like amidohydrolase
LEVTVGYPLARLLFAILPMLLGAQPAPGVSPQPLIFTHVTIIDATGAPPQADMSVVIASARIAELGRTGEIAVPAGARIIDAAGKFLIPGLWDMHVHWYDKPTLPVFIANGVTGVRIMCGFPLHLKWRREVADGTLLGPRMVLAGPIVDGPQPVWPDSLRASNPDEGRLAVQTIKKQGYDCVKVYDLLPASAYFAVAGEAKKLGLPLVGHVPFAVSAARVSDAGQRNIEHLSGVSLACSFREAELRKELQAVRDRPATALLLRFEVEAEDSYDGAKAAALFARFVKNGTWLAPTLAVRQAHATLTENSLMKSSRQRYLPPALKSRWDGRRSATFKRLGPADFANFKQSLGKQLELVRVMHRAGVKFLAGTDTGALDCLPGFSLHDELELLVKGGLTPMEALQAATLNPAQCLERLSDLGTIERGKLADLVLLDADPLDDIRNTTKVHAVLINGRLLQKTDLRAMLDEVETSCKQRRDPEPPPGAYPRYP